MAKRSVLGKSRTHDKPGTDAAKLLENEMARREYTGKLYLAKVMVSKGVLSDVGKVMTKVRRTGGIAIRTPFGYTSRPHVIEVGIELARRKNTAMAYLINAKGILDYHRKYFRSNLRHGTTGPQNDIIARLCVWCDRTLKYSLALEKKLGLRHLSR